MAIFEAHEIFHLGFNFLFDFFTATKLEFHVGTKKTFFPDSWIVFFLELKGDEADKNIAPQNGQKWCCEYFNFTAPRSYIPRNFFFISTGCDDLKRIHCGGGKSSLLAFIYTPVTQSLVTTSDAYRLRRHT